MIIPAETAGSNWKVAQGEVKRASASTVSRGSFAGDAQFECEKMIYTYMHLQLEKYTSIIQQPLSLSHTFIQHFRGFHTSQAVRKHRWMSGAWDRSWQFVSGLTSSVFSSQVYGWSLICFSLNMLAWWKFKAYQSLRPPRKKNMCIA